MNKTIAEAVEFAHQSHELQKFANSRNVDIGVAPTYLSLAAVRKENPGLIVAAQNCHFEDHGAFTGEISIPMLQELGVKWVIVGHSERRTYFAETNESCNRKLHALTAAGLHPIYCCGETLEQFEKGQTKKVIEEQIVKGLADLDPEDLERIVIAYEPVWAIGTGKNASKEIAEDICGFIRKIIAREFGEVSESIRILYGGSVKPENIHDYIMQPNVDGALVGGASLKVDSFHQLIENIGESGGQL